MAGTGAIVDSPADVADLEFLFLLLLGAAAIVRGAAWLHVPYPIALVLVGLAAGAIPGLPEVVIEPDVLFLVFLPPLLASAGFYSSPRELRAEWRPLTVLALGAVLATTCGVAVAAHELIDGLGWPAAFVLGAVVAPTDPVAAQATFSRMHVPERVGMLVEGEAMINDASALVAFRVALGAAIAGSFSVATPRSTSSSPRSPASRSASPRAGSRSRSCASSTTGRSRSCCRCCSRTRPTSPPRRRTSPGCWPRSRAGSTSAGSRTRRSAPTRA
jgi:hypothetical protein